MTSGLNEIQASVNTVIDNFLAVDPVLLLQVGVKTRLNVVHNGLPAERTRTRVRSKYAANEETADLSSLLTKSPNPGVSTTVRRSLTPFSSMSVEAETVSARPAWTDGTDETYQR